MNIEYLKEKKELVSIIFIGFSVVFAFLVLMKLANCFTVSARAENLARTAIEQNNTDSQDMQNYLKPSRDLAATLKRDNLFAPSVPDQHPVKEVRAIFGDEILIENKWYETGQMVGSAKIVSIEPTSVKIEWEGREKDFKPINASIPEAAKPGRTVARGGGSSQDRADMVVIGSDSTSIQDRGGRREFGAGAFPGGGRGQMGGFQGMRQGFQNMSEAEREVLRNEMRQRFGGGGFGRGQGEGNFDRGQGGGRGQGGRQGRGRGGQRGG